MKITSTNEQGITVLGQFTAWDEEEGREIVAHWKTISWDILRAAAKQEDKELARVYADLLATAEKMEEKRCVSENWKLYGYPLLTGFGSQFRGQIVMRAWEIRLKKRKEGDVKVAYIVAYDQSVNRIEVETTSPELPDVNSCYEWLSAYYGGWDNELGGERTASTWLVG